MFLNEISILQSLETIRTGFLNQLFQAITTLGEETPLIILLAVLYFMVNKDLARRLFFITAVSININGIIKNIVKLPRPFSQGAVTCIRQETATGYSFPSGHTQNVATWTSALAFKHKKIWLTLLAVLLTLLTAFSRMYLGVHYLSDVIVGAGLGVLLSFILNRLYDRAGNKTYIISIITMSIFAIFFLINPDPHYADFYKSYGMLGGLYLSVLFEEKYVAFDCSGSLFKRLLHVIISIVIAFLVKELSAMVFTSHVLRISLILSAVRYFLLVFVVLGICPYIYNKLKI